MEKGRTGLGIGGWPFLRDGLVIAKLVLNIEA